MLNPNDGGNRNSLAVLADHALAGSRPRTPPHSPSSSPSNPGPLYGLPIHYPTDACRLLDHQRVLEQTLRSTGCIMRPVQNAELTRLFGSRGTSIFVVPVESEANDGFLLAFCKAAKTLLDRSPQSAGINSASPARPAIPSQLSEPSDVMFMTVDMVVSLSVAASTGKLRRSKASAVDLPLGFDHAGRPYLPSRIKSFAVPDIIALYASLRIMHDAGFTAAEQYIKSRPAKARVRNTGRPRTDRSTSAENGSASTVSLIDAKTSSKLVRRQSVKVSYTKDSLSEKEAAEYEKILKLVQQHDWSSSETTKEKFYESIKDMGVWPYGSMKNYCRRFVNLLEVDCPDFATRARVKSRRLRKLRRDLADWREPLAESAEGGSVEEEAVHDLPAEELSALEEESETDERLSSPSNSLGRPVDNAIAGQKRKRSCHHIQRRSPASVSADADLAADLAADLSVDLAVDLAADLADAPYPSEAPLVPQCVGQSPVPDLAFSPPIRPAGERNVILTTAAADASTVGQDTSRGDELSTPSTEGSTLDEVVLELDPVGESIEPVFEDTTASIIPEDSALGYDHQFEATDERMYGHASTLQHARRIDVPTSHPTARPTTRVLSGRRVVSSTPSTNRSASPHLPDRARNSPQSSTLTSRTRHSTSPAVDSAENRPPCSIGAEAVKSSRYYLGPDIAAQLPDPGITPQIPPQDTIPYLQIPIAVDPKDLGRLLAARDEFRLREGRSSPAPASNLASPTGIFWSKEDSNRLLLIDCSGILDLANLYWMQLLRDALLANEATEDDAPEGEGRAEDGDHGTAQETQGRQTILIDSFGSGLHGWEWIGLGESLKSVGKA